MLHVRAQRANERIQIECSLPIYFRGRSLIGWEKVLFVFSVELENASIVKVRIESEHSNVTKVCYAVESMKSFIQ